MWWLLLLPAILLMMYVLARKYSARQPKQYRQPSDAATIREFNKKMYRQFYRKEQIPPEIDAIIIGSGISGLTVAATLSKLNWRVLVLEQHDTPGGAMHMFREGGVDHETGIHYVGEPLKFVQPMLDFLSVRNCDGIVNQVQWHKMGGTEGLYDEIVYSRSDAKTSTEQEGPKEQEMKTPELRHRLRAGLPNFISDLNEKFPNDTKAIKKYVTLVQASEKYNQIFHLLKIVQSQTLRKILQFIFSCTNGAKRMQKTVMQVLTEEITQDVDLIAILTGQWGDYGDPPEIASWALHAAIVAHYWEGGYYPVGGSTAIIRQLLPSIYAAGGAVLCKASVNQILTEPDATGGQKVWGVLVNDRDYVYCDKIISAVGICNTDWLLNNTGLKEKSSILQSEQIVQNTGFSCSFIYAFVTLDGTTDELNLPSHNIWYYPVSGTPIFIASGASKDPSWKERFPNKASVILLTTCHPQDWLHLSQQSNEYLEKKKESECYLLEEGLFKYYPHLRDRIHKVSIGTPKTSETYLRSFQGAAYGLSYRPKRFNMQNLSPSTPIQGLWQTGQDITVLGLCGAMAAGLLTTHALLGYGTVWDILCGRSVMSDLHPVEIASQSPVSTPKPAS